MVTMQVLATDADAPCCAAVLLLLLLLLLLPVVLLPLLTVRPSAGVILLVF